MSPISYFRLAWSLAVLLVGLAAGPVQAQIYVDADNTSGTQNGDSWSTAYAGLQMVVNDASSSSEIWIAEGTYTPDPGGANDRSKGITVSGGKDGVELYGGFDGMESTRSARDPDAHPTVLSGDIDGDDTATAHIGA